MKFMYLIQLNIFHKNTCYKNITNKSVDKFVFKLICCKTVKTECDYLNSKFSKLKTRG